MSMGRGFMAALAALAVVAVVGGPAPAAPAAASTAGDAADDLRAALLTVGDLPSGYTPVSVATSGDGKISIGADFPGCPALSPLTDDRTTAAAATYTAGAMGPYLSDALIRFPIGSAAGAMNRLAGAVTNCPAFEQQLAGLTMRFRVTRSSAPATLGDQVLGLQLTGTTDFGISMTAGIIAIRRGDLVLWLNDLSIGGASAGLADNLAAAAVAHCTAHVHGC